MNAQLASMGVASSWEEILKQTLVTVKEGVRLKGRHEGGKRITMHRIGTTWGSTAHTMNYDLQGDLRWFIELVGPEAADFFGFELFDDKTMTIPDFTEFTGAIAKVNAELIAMGKKPIAISFYLTPDEKNVAVRIYAGNFVEFYGIPLSPSGHHRTHDMSFHTGAIFIPESLLRHKAAAAEFAFAFGEYLKRIFAQAPEPTQKAAAYYAYIANFMSTVDIDRGTAHAGTSLMGYLKQQQQAKGGEADQSAQLLFSAVYGNFISPFSELDMLKSRLTFPETARFQEANVRRTQVVLPPDVVMEHLEAFSANYKSTLFPEFDPKVNYGPTIKGEELCQEFHQRRLEIAEAVRRIKARESRK